MQRKLSNKDISDFFLKIIKLDYKGSNKIIQYVQSWNFLYQSVKLYIYINLKEKNLPQCYLD